MAINSIAARPATGSPAESAPPKRIVPQAVVTYTHEGQAHSLYLYLEFGSLLVLTRTLQWAYHKGIAVSIEWLNTTTES